MTGAGKTVYGVEEFNKYKDLKIFLNIQEENYPLAAKPIRKLENLDFEYSAYNYFIKSKNAYEIVYIQQFLFDLQRARMGINPEARILLVVDEADEFCSRYHKEKDPMYLACKELSKRSRRWNIDLIWIVQRPVELNNMIFSQCDLFVFYYMSPGEWAYITDPQRANIKMPYTIKKNDETGMKEKIYLPEEHCKPYQSYKYVIYDKVKFIYRNKIPIKYGAPPIEGITPGESK